MANGIGVGWAVLFSLVIAEIVNCAARIVSQSEDEPMMMPTSGFIAKY